MGPFIKVFVQVIEGLILKLYETIRVLHGSAYATVFILFDEQDCQGRVFKVIKNDNFSVLLDVLLLFPSILKLHKIMRVLYLVECPIVFILFYE